LVGEVLAVVPSTELTSPGEEWAEASTNAALRLGDALRTNEQGNAVVRLAGAGQMRIGPGSLVRFAEFSGEEGGDGEQELRLVIEEGALDVAMAEGEAPLLVLDSPEGRIRVDRGSQLRLTIDEANQVQLEVMVGLAHLEQEGEDLEVGAGQTIFLGEAQPVPVQPITDGGAGALGSNSASEADSAATDEQPVAQTSDPDLALVLSEAVRVQISRGAVLQVQAPGDEGFSRVRGARTKLAPGTQIRVSGRRGVRFSGPAGASIEVQPGGQGVVLGQEGQKLGMQLHRGSFSAQSAAKAQAFVAVRDGVVETASMGKGARFTASTVGRGRARVAVKQGAAEVRVGGERQLVETGAELVFGGGQAPSISHRPEVPPVLPSASAVIHDPQRQGHFTVRFEPLPGCELYRFQVTHNGRDYLNGVTSKTYLPFTNVRLGDYRWQASCASPSGQGERRQGRVVRRADKSGQLVLPTGAPRNRLESDGQNYTIMYQNKLPALTLHWSKAPRASAYALEVYDDSSGRRVHRGRQSKASKTFRSGFFSEGSYYWFFRAEGASRRAASPVTRVGVRFDNVLPAIQIMEPRDGATMSGGTVRVRGVVAVGSSVVVSAVQLELSGDFRFDQEVPIGPRNMLVFQVTTPRRGSSFYLRHLRR
jgi:hypothetical protein